MPRMPRMIVKGETAVYHVISRTPLDGLPIKSDDKDFMFALVKRLSKVYFTEVIGLTVMSNHFHLLCRMVPEDRFSDGDVTKRFKLYYSSDEDERELTDGQIPSFREKWGSLSEFVKEIKQRFTRYYNKKNNRKGFFWGDRFKSILVQNGETLVNCLAYIDLNPVRAGMVEKPEQYRWSSLGYHVQTENRDDFFSGDFGFEAFGMFDFKERMERYRRYVYEAGALESKKGKSIDAGILKKEKAKGFQLTKKDRFLYKTRCVTDFGIIGSRAFVLENFERFGELLGVKNDRKPKRIKGLDGIYSMRRLE